MSMSQTNTLAPVAANARANSRPMPAAPAVIKTRCGIVASSPVRLYACTNASVARMSEAIYGFRLSDALGESHAVTHGLTGRGFSAIIPSGARQHAGEAREKSCLDFGPDRGRVGAPNSEQRTAIGVLRKTGPWHSSVFSRQSRQACVCIWNSRL